MALGIANHNGWAVGVCVAVRDGAAEVIDRRRIELLDADLPKLPYEHETRDMNTAQAENLVREVRESALRCAECELSRLRKDHEIGVIGLREPVLPQMPSTVAEVHASHHLLARADAMLYHVVLCEATATLGIEIWTIRKGDEVARAAEALGTSAQNVTQWLAEQGKILGAPWQKDHREAAARAIAALGNKRAVA